MPNYSVLEKAIKDLKEKVKTEKLIQKNNNLKIISIHTDPALTKDDLTLYYEKLNKFHNEFINQWNIFGKEIMEIIIDGLELTPKKLKDPNFNLGTLIQEKYNLSNDNLIMEVINSIPNYMKKKFVSSSEDFRKYARSNQFNEIYQQPEYRDDMDMDMDEDIEDTDEIEDYDDEEYDDDVDSDVDIENLLERGDEKNNNITEKFDNFVNTLTPEEAADLILIFNSGHSQMKSATKGS